MRFVPSANLEAFVLARVVGVVIEHLEDGVDDGLAHALLHDIHHLRVIVRVEVVVLHDAVHEAPRQRVTRANHTAVAHPPHPAAVSTRGSCFTSHFPVGQLHGVAHTPPPTEPDSSISVGTACGDHR
jgi:hypothetical protein